MAKLDKEEKREIVNHANEFIRQDPNRTGYRITTRNLSDPEPETYKAYLNIELTEDIDGIMNITVCHLDNEGKPKSPEMKYIDRHFEDAVRALFFRMIFEGRAIEQNDISKKQKDLEASDVIEKARVRCLLPETRGRKKDRLDQTGLQNETREFIDRCMAAGFRVLGSGKRVDQNELGSELFPSDKHVEKALRYRFRQYGIDWKSLKGQIVKEYRLSTEKRKKKK